MREEELGRGLFQRDATFLWGETDRHFFGLKSAQAFF
jgi:hypothetical protein